MKTFTLSLHDATHSEEIREVTSFIGEDASGSFGILAGHARFITSLNLGLARFRIAPKPWQYIALPGAVLYFHNNILTLTTQRYLLDNDYKRISQALENELLAEEKKLHAIKQSLHHMEEAVLKRLWEVRRAGMN